MEQQPFDPMAHFPQFYANPVIADLADAPKWTVSSTKTTETRRAKFPVDMRCLLDGGTSKDGRPVQPGTIRGAFRADATCLVTLTELTTRFPMASNCAYHLNTQLDGYLVLDIEKTCPPHEAARLLSMTEDLYRETSMSERGYHLVLPPPDNFWEWPDAVGKRVLKHPEGWWEILMEHWITFTRNPIPPEHLDRLAKGRPIEAPTWEQVWAELATVAEPTASVDFDFELDRPEIPHEDLLVDAIIGPGHGRTPEQFGNDMSRYEFSVLGVYDKRLEVLLDTVTFPDHTQATDYDDTARVWLLYLAAARSLEQRPKHAELRSGMPYLLKQASSMRGNRLAQREMTIDGRRAR